MLNTFLLYLISILLTVVVSTYVLFKFEFVQCIAKTLLAKFLAWHTARGAKDKLNNKQLINLKKKLFGSLSDVIQTVGGPVLEVGAGSGANLVYYPDNVKLLTIDLNEHFRSYLETNLKVNSHVTLEKYLIGRVEDMTELVEDNSCSCVVSSLLLCCTEQQQALSEIHRVLKPGGRFYFIEHIIDVPGSWTRWFQEKFNSTWQSIRGNCTLIRNTDHVIQQCEGFTNLNASVMYRDLHPLYFFNMRSYVGYADKR